MATDERASSETSKQRWRLTSSNLLRSGLVVLGVVMVLVIGVLVGRANGPEARTVSVSAPSSSTAPSTSVATAVSEESPLTSEADTTTTEAASPTTTVPTVASGGQSSPPAVPTSIQARARVVTTAPSGATSTTQGVGSGGGVAPETTTTTPPSTGPATTTTTPPPPPPNTYPSTTTQSARTCTIRITQAGAGVESSGYFTTDAPPGTTYQVVAAPDSSDRSYSYAQYSGNVTNGTTGSGNSFRFYESRRGDYTIDVYLGRSWDGRPNCSRQILL